MICPFEANSSGAGRPSISTETPPSWVGKRSSDAKSASAAGVAGLLQELAAGESYTGSTVVVTVTGHGLKDTATALEAYSTAQAEQGRPGIVDTVIDNDVVAAARAAGLA